MAARKGKQKWDAGSIILIPLLDGSTCIAQVAARTPKALNSAWITMFDARGSWNPADLPHLSSSDVFASLLVTRDLLDSGRWKVAKDSPVVVSPSESPLAKLSSDLIGAKIRGSGIVEDFVNAFYGLLPWDDWYRPDYLDEFLLAPSKKPNDRLVMCGRHAQKH